MKPRDRYIYAFITFVLIIAALSLASACTESSTSTHDPRLDALEQRVNTLENQVGLLEDELHPPTPTPLPTLTAEERDRQAVGTEKTNVQAAIDAAIADNSLTAVDARYNCNDFSASGGCGLTGGTVPANFLYPNYLRFRTAGDSRTYSWDRTGLASTP